MLKASLTELRQTVAARLLGGPVHTRPPMAQRNLARIWGARTPGCRTLMAYYPCRRLDGSLCLGGGQGKQVCGADIVWSPVAQSWGRCSSSLRPKTICPGAVSMGLWRPGVRSVGNPIAALVAPSPAGAPAVVAGPGAAAGAHRRLPP